MDCRDNLRGEVETKSSGLGRQYGGERIKWVRWERNPIDWGNNTKGHA